MHQFRGRSEPLILLTNDDGVQSPGLFAAVRAVTGLGRVVVVAPTTQQTSRGRGMFGDFTDILHRTMLPELDVEAEIEAYHIDASPALAVQHAMNTIFVSQWPDLVVSGINYGENLGLDITISGTVGAAFQAAAYGIPAIAASQQVGIEHHYEYGEVDWQGSTRVLRKYTGKLLDALTALPASVALSGRDRLSEPRPFPFDVLKIDAPLDCPPGTAERISRLARRHYFTFSIDAPTDESPIGAGRTRVDDHPGLIRPGDDIHTVAHDHAVAITPLVVDFTAPLEESARVLGL
ncbi:MAG: 5'/3'-nucleotidase SurE [Spirochaetota bacterium]